MMHKKLALLAVSSLVFVSLNICGMQKGRRYGMETKKERLAKKWVNYGGYFTPLLKIFGGCALACYGYKNVGKSSDIRSNYLYGGCFAAGLVTTLSGTFSLLKQMIDPCKTFLRYNMLHKTNSRTDSMMDQMMTAMTSPEAQNMVTQVTTAMTNGTMTQMLQMMQPDNPVMQAVTQKLNNKNSETKSEQPQEEAVD